MAVSVKTYSEERIEPRPARARLVQLDLLRGVAILLVLGSHSAVSSVTAGILVPFAKVWVYFGWTGVDLFFVLSGFLVGGLLFQEMRRYGKIEVGRFLIRRGFKIWPSYFVFVGFVFVLEGIRGSFAKSGHDILSNLLHIQNYWPTVRAHTWSLSVEEHFYLALPLLLLVLSRLKLVAKLPTLAFCVIVFCTTLRLLLNWNRPFGEYTHHYPTHLRIDSLTFGVCLSYFYYFHPALFTSLRKYQTQLLCLGLFLVAPMILNLKTWRFVPTIGYTMLYLGYGAILVVLMNAEVGRGRIGKFLSSRLCRLVATIGFYSYPIYLWHVDTGSVATKWILETGIFSWLPESVSWVILSLIYIALSSFAGMILGRLVEIPALALRDRLFPARTAVIRGGLQ